MICPNAEPPSADESPLGDEHHNSPEDQNAESGAGPGSRAGDRRSKRRRIRPVPPDLAEADEIEDGHLRVIDPRAAGARIYPDHGLTLDLIDPDSIKVVSRLQRHGFQAYLVGGCVRDLLLGFRPKDFDIATSATPRQIKKLFRNSRVIGRRFRLVHVHFGRHVLEVSTFRSDQVPPSSGDDLLIRRDNVFGCADQDARRRDFTCNALFLDIERSEIIDFVGGIEDLRRRRIEVIGDPVTRLREDPVRMLRAVKFAGRLGFEIADDLHDAIRLVREDLRRSAAPRLLEEVLRLLNNRGGAFAAFRLLHHTNLLDVLLPELVPVASGALNRPESPGGTASEKFWNSLRALDRMIMADRQVSNALLLAVPFCHLLDHILNHSGPIPEGEKPVDYDMVVMADRFLDPLALRLQVPRRDIYRFKQIVIALRRFITTRTARKRPSAAQFIRKDYFLDSLKLFQIYSEATGLYKDEVARWEARYRQAVGSIP